MTGTVRSFQEEIKVSQVDHLFFLLGIHLFNGGHEEDVALYPRKHFFVSFGHSRVAFEIRFVVKLSWIDKNAAYGDLTMRFCGLNQRQMAWVEGAHGGHKTDAKSLFFKTFQLSEEF